MTLLQPRLWTLITISLSTALGISMVRALFPTLLFRPATTNVSIALSLAFIFLAPLWAMLLSRLISHRKLLSGSFAVLVTARFLVQCSTDQSLNLVLIGAGAAAGLMALTLQLRYAPRSIGAALVVGLSLDAALNSITSTWDVIWQHNPIAIAAIGLACVLTFAASALAKSPQSDQGNSASPIVWCVFLALHLFIFHNIGFLTASTHLHSYEVLAMVLAGDIIGICLSGYQSSTWVRSTLALILVVLTLAINPLDVGYPAITLLVMQVMSIYLALSAKRVQHDLVRFGISALFGSLTAIGLIVGWYAGYQSPLPEWTSSVLQAAAASVFVLASIQPQTLPYTDRRWAVVLAALLIVPLVMALTRPVILATPAEHSPIRLMTYNVHQGANMDGAIDLEGIAATIEDQKPNIVVRQEVTRGQLITGSADMVTWLGNRLQMETCFSPAADFTFGELLLTNVSLTYCGGSRLPKGSAAQYRSEVTALVQANGVLMSIMGTHLDHTSREARELQIEQLLYNWQQFPFNIIVGDMNAATGAPEMQLFSDAGFVDAQTMTGNAAVNTFPSIEPRAHRLDFRDTRLHVHGLFCSRIDCVGPPARCGHNWSDTQKSFSLVPSIRVRTRSTDF